ncbi:MAG: alpha-amylase family glycosyl hydrolase, partial [Candidatus Sumerlaeota bacterium]
MRRTQSFLRIAAMAAAIVCMGTAAHAVTIFTDSFASSTLGASWTKGGTATWRVQTSTTYRNGASGYGVAFDSSASSTYATSRLDLHQNLAGYSTLSLSFKMRNVGDEIQSQDGVYISADGVTFYKCSWTYPAIGSTFNTQTVDISATASTNHIVLGPDAVIRFQQYDNSPLSSDGIAIDDVTLTGVIATPVASVKPGMGAIPYTSGGYSGSTFRVWAPNASAVSVAGDFNAFQTNRHPLASEGGSGNWSVDVPDALINDQYKYYITYSGTGYWRQDPRAQDMTNDSGNSIIADLAYTWANSFTMPAWNEMVMYEAHIGTFYRSSGGTPGTFNDATTKLQYLKDRGINAIELLPIMEFPGMTSWGYNPHSQFAPESDYGTPKQMKQFVDAAHAKGIAVILDVVYNHMGSSPNETAIPIWNFDGPSFGNGGIYFFADSRKQTPWGWSRPDYGRNEVRAFLHDSALYWLNEYHTD